MQPTVELPDGTSGALIGEMLGFIEMARVYARRDTAALNAEHTFIADNSGNTANNGSGMALFGTKLEPNIENVISRDWDNLCKLLRLLEPAAGLEPATY